MILAAGLFVHFRYFFNPLTFRRDEVTHLPWSWYERPLEIEYIVHGERNKQRVITDEHEVQMLITELKKGAHLPHGDARWDQQTGKQFVHVTVVRERDHADLLVAKGTWDQGVLFVSSSTGPVAVTLTDELKQLFQQRFAEAQ